MPVHVDDSLVAAADCLLDQRFRAAFAIGQCTQQHRQADAGDAFDPSGVEQLQCEIGRRGAQNVGEDQDAIALIDLLEGHFSHRQDSERIILCGHAELTNQGRAFVQDMTNVLDQAFAKRAVRYQEDTDHWMRVP